MTALSTRQPSAALAEANTVLRQKGRTFYWARWLLKDLHADRATRLYSLCRYLDDLADESTSAVASRSALNHVRQAIHSGRADHPVVHDGLLLITQCGIDPHVVCQLIDGVCSDLDTVAMATLDDLLRYCYQVAGTVGLMMCNVLGADDPAAWPHAVDLGIAMQLTNICRDVQCDAAAGRRYLPASMVGELLPTALVSPAAHIQPQLQDCLRQLLDMADHYYRSAELGLSYLPAGARTGILTAARIYREIGVCLARRDFQYWQGRVVVSPMRKVVVTSNVLAGAPLRRSFWGPTYAHDAALHRAFSALLSRNVSTSMLHGQ